MNYKVVSFILTALVGGAIAIGLHGGIDNVVASIQKRSEPADQDVWLRIDRGNAPIPGKRVYYQLTDEEGGVDFARKVPAVILFWHGHGEVDLFVTRPARLGGAFSKDNVLKGIRPPGTWDIAGPGDLIQ